MPETEPISKTTPARFVGYWQSAFGRRCQLGRISTLLPLRSAGETPALQGRCVDMACRFGCIHSRALMSIFLLASCLCSIAYPPTPYHTIYGLVRDQYGAPLRTTQAKVILRTPTGTTLATTVIPDLAIGVNYLIRVPMDSGLTPDMYKSTALESASTFTIVVVIGTATNMPIQLAGSLAQLGQPAQMTRLDLTLGVDSNHDALPDAWELAFLASLGSTLGLADLNAGLDLAHDGRTLMQEFLLGSSTPDTGQPFLVSLDSLSTGTPTLGFPTVSGRTYSVLGSPDLRQWTPLQFRLTTDSPGAPPRSSYQANATGAIDVRVVPTPSVSPVQFFRIQLQ